jgi:Family of unknown function (DUF5989)
MSAPPGYAASSSTDERHGPPAEPAAISRRPRSTYLQGLALRREAAAIRRQSVYGLVMGWVLTLVAGFLLFCVPSRLDWLWAILLAIGGLHLAAAVLLPQALAWPERVWIAIARLQGWLVMTTLLTIVFYLLIWPASFFSGRRTRGFVTWDDQPPPTQTAWEKFDLVEIELAETSSNRYRSLPLLLAGVIAFFFRRGDYVLLPILILLIVLGLVLYFVQSSALAPFIYTIF